MEAVRIKKAWAVVRDKNRTPTEYLINETLDLINRLQAENEDKQTVIKEQGKIINGLLECQGKAIVAAYKEFAEKAVEQVEKARQKYQRLCKEQGDEMEEHMHIHFNGITKIINNLLKEMGGEDNG